MDTTRAKLVSRPLPKSLQTSSASTVINVSEKGAHAHKPSTFNEDPTLQQGHMLGKHTDFSGEARVAQVLRWTSTSALIANDIFKSSSETDKSRKRKANTPEAQSTVIGGRLIIGTNAEDDSHIPAQLQKLLSDKSLVKSTVEDLEGQSEGYVSQALFAESDEERDKLLEQSRVGYQQARHLSQLHQFVSDDSVFSNFAGQARQEIADHYEQQNADSTGSAESYMYGLKNRQKSTSSMFRNLRSSLKGGGTIDMATNTKGKHAEQRIVEDVLKHHDVEVERTKAARGFTVFSDTPPPDHLNMVVAGTKPPCAMCEVTEQARQQVAQSPTRESSPLVMRRFKDEHYQTGNLFPGKYTNTEDTHVHGRMKAQFSSPDTFPKTRVTARKRADSVANFKAFKDL
ncbi:hypothetical protein [Thalassomonas sp. RHCl1]|uniref:hypothetical protein n=1 Tax=Thalassomonas sp. RHCl1 TaxID=2995320 RepID=UPI00248C5CF0|nr:hypothetical protein [Thalassomonas sp. RHCl1]